MILACVLGYVACAIAAGYVMGINGADANGQPTTFLAILTGPLGLMFAAGHLAHQHGERRREIAEARHRLALAELEQQEREIAKLLGGEVRR